MVAFPFLSSAANALMTLGGRIWIWSIDGTKAHLFSPKTSPWTVFADAPSSSVVSDVRASDNLFVLGDEVWLGGPMGRFALTAERG